jgi:hypothetical protein
MKVAAILCEIENLDKDAFRIYNKEIDEQTAIDLIKTRCSEMVYNPLFRGLERTSTPFLAVDSSQIKRSSKDNSNEYTELMSNTLQSWKGWPPRDRATICLSNAQYAASMYGQGEFYFVYPENGTKLAIAPDNDIWNSFSYLLDAVGEELEKAKAFGMLDSVMSYTKHRGSAHGAATFEQALALPANLIFTSIGSKTKGRTILQFLEHFMAPGRNGFELTTTSQYSKRSGEHEVWFSGRAVLVHQDAARKLEKYYK